MSSHQNSVPVTLVTQPYVDDNPQEETEPPSPPNREELLSRVRAFPFWLQRIYLGHGVYTLRHPHHNELIWHRLASLLPQELSAVSVLDVGCNAGYFSLKLKQRGADRVVGIESRQDYLGQAQLCRDVWGLDIDYRLEDAHDMTHRDERFDLVLFTGILYHLKNPLAVLEDLGQLCSDAIVVETEAMPEKRQNRVFVRIGRYGHAKVTECQTGLMKFIESDELYDDGSNWWVPDTECVKGMLRTAGFKYFSAPHYLTETRLLLLASKKSNTLLELAGLDSD